MPLPKPKGALVLDSACTAAPGSNVMILKNVSLKIAAGEVVTVIGPSASGKSSLARLLVGIWPAVSGSVRLDGADVHTRHLRATQAQAYPVALAGPCQPQQLQQARYRYGNRLIARGFQRIGAAMRAGFVKCFEHLRRIVAAGHREAATRQPPRDRFGAFPPASGKPRG